MRKGTCGIYCIRNRYTGKVYVGSSREIEKRWYQHRYELNRGIHKNGWLQNSWRKYPETAWEFSIIEECSGGLIIGREQYWLDRLESYNPEFGYNIRSVAESNIGVPRKRGYKRPKEVGIKVSKAKTGFRFTEESKKKMSLAKKGRILGEAHRKIIGKASMKPVELEDGSWFESVSLAAAFFGLCKTSLYYYIKHGRKIRGMSIKMLHRGKNALN